MFLIRLYRILPLIIIFAVIALIVYMVTLYRHSKPRAQDIVLRFVIWACVIVGGFFLLATLYALLEQNLFVVEFFGSCVLFFALCLGVALICRAVFLKHHPSYKKKAMKTKFLKGSRKKK